MPRDYGEGNQYVKPAVLVKINAALHNLQYSQSELAFDLRMDRSHVNRLLRGKAHMAHHHMLAIKFLLIQRKTNIDRQAALDRLVIGKQFDTTDVENIDPTGEER